jgi:hypothetical protein
VVEVERLEGVVGVEKIESLDGMLIETEMESWKGESCWSPVGTENFLAARAREPPFWFRGRTYLRR